MILLELSFEQYRALAGHLITVEGVAQGREREYRRWAVELDTERQREIALGMAEEARAEFGVPTRAQRKRAGWGEGGTMERNGCPANSRAEWRGICDDAAMSLRDKLYRAAACMEGEQMQDSLPCSE